MSEYIAYDDFFAVMQECFERGQDVSFTPSGISMRPMLNGRDDIVTLSPRPDRLKKYDVALYIRKKTHKPVLHRMIAFDKNGGYIFSGDNQYYYEYGVEDDDIKAVLTSYIHKGKKRDIRGISYRIYVGCMMFRKRLRMLAAKMYHMINNS